MGIKVAIAVLAAGRSTRMGSFNKLLSRFGGVPLVKQSITRAIAAGRGPVFLVTGHMADEIREAISGLPVAIVHNSGYASGLSSSIRTALRVIPDDCAGVLIHLADMPLVTEIDITAISDAFICNEGGVVVRATACGKPGNPVVLPRSLFSELSLLEGDTGARGLIAASNIPVIDVEIGRAASYDVDTPETLEAAGGVRPSS